MKKQLALALLLAGSVLNTSFVMADNEGTKTGSTIASKFNDVTGYLVGKKDAAVAQAKAHPYIASAAAVTTFVAVALKCSATFRRLFGMETQEDMNKRYSAFEI